MDLFAIATAIFLVFLGAGINEYIRRRQRIEPIGREIYTAKLNAAKEISSAFFVFFSSKGMGISHKEAILNLCKVLGPNALLFPKNVTLALVEVINTATSDNPGQGIKMHDALNLIKVDLGLPRLEQGFFQEVIKGIESRPGQEKK